MRGQSVDVPIMTVDEANRYGLMTPSLVKFYGNDQHGQTATVPLHTITAKGREALVTPVLSKMFGASTEQSITEPVPTTLANNHDALIFPYVSKYFSGGYDGVWRRLLQYHGQRRLLRRV